MSRSTRPPSLTTLVRRLCHDQGLVARGETVLCACSGGPDSTAMLHVLALLQSKLGHRVVAVGVDHGLRPEADTELDLAAQVARAQGVPFERVSVSLEPGSNLQARARKLRYEALAAAARRASATAVAVGHTADDRAETLLMRLLRGAGPRGLAVMPPRTSLVGDRELQVVRPLLLARRADVTAHLLRQKLPWAEDPSNQDRRYTRVRVRVELIPLLEELSPRIVEHLCHLADMLAADDADPLAELGREQRLAIRRALRLGHPRTTVRVSGGRDLVVSLRRVGRAKSANLHATPVDDAEQ